MSKKQYQIFVSKNFFEQQIAFCTPQQVQEIWVDRGHPDAYIVGNIYLGQVDRVLPGMQAAFVDIGLEKNGFLYEGDLVAEQDEDLDYIDDDSTEAHTQPNIPSFQALRAKDTILVQVTKGPIASKGARLTTNVTITGKFLVLMPLNRRIGISKKIRSSQDRDRLHSCVRAVRRKENIAYGIIIRTAASTITAKRLQEEYLELAQMWHTVLSDRKKANPPALLYNNNNILDRMLREYCGHPKTKIIVDDPETFETLVDKAKQSYSFPIKNISLYDNQRSLFEDFGIEQELMKALDRRVWLNNGGYLVFEETEALTVVDVNTGRYVGRKNLEDTLIQTNLEAAVEVVHQITLRNLSGIIIVDFIDMDDPKHRQKILDTLRRHLKDDKVKNSVISMTQLGLVQITRKRTHPSILHQLSTSCPYCDGKGMVKSQETVVLEILKHIKDQHLTLKKRKRITVRVAEPTYQAFNTTYKSLIKHIIREFKTTIVFQPDPEFHIEEHEVV